MSILTTLATPLLAVAATLSTLLMQPTAGNIYGFEARTIEGKPVALSSFKGQKLLIVNTASECGYTPQYKELEALAKQYAGKITVIGFPANNFGGQEPGTNAEIKTFCEKNYGVTFPIMEKVSVKGEDAHPLFKFLADPKQAGDAASAPKWNFTKFFINEKGELVKVFPSSVKPLDKQITDLI